MSDEKKDMLNPEKMPTKPSAVQRLARNQFAKKKRPSPSSSYKDGDPLDKVWDNYQITKGLKREFKELCDKKKIVASEYLRACVRLLIKKDGDVKKALKAVEKIDPSKLKD
jgi:hypothetical protein